ncbi:Gfo/Idh/MocA family oxidoreductase [Novosphingobium sp. YJ-S2-02]|uniref:Gfo/Idh/MocA family oxidoreductase n=1 Tax=Novosphingobium aureum TaxID=2792964 RepID=A0A931MMH7_9SPHN|nr:Gfo/Idh/MocA family oxidoreductase [Novosphingobium aureum]MBH0114444.1 Gfo/Idh/MocA family oxidoreductase [Novosphingobium aureum]
MTLRVGIVGAAWGGMAHLPAWRAVPGVEVTAVCTSREESARAAAEKLGVERAFWDAHALCSDPDIDIVDLGTRPNFRLPWLETALRCGKHVYNASPHAPGWEGAKAIDAAWRTGGSVGVVDAFIEYVPAVRRQIELVREGYIGRPIGGTCHLNISLFNRASKQFPYNWFARGDAGVSGLRNNGSHALYPLLAMLGPVGELVADDRQVLPEWIYEDGDRVTPETTDTGNALLRFESGVVMQLQAGWAMTMHDGWLLDIYGTEGRLVSRAPTFPSAQDCTLEGLRAADKPNPHAPTQLQPIDLPETYRAEQGIAIDASFPIPPCFPMALSMRRMVETIEGKAGSALAAPDFARALEVERCQEAMRLSQAGRRWIALSDVV